jgi:4-hydroxy-tetrahydrodipicolinate synthase
MFHGSMVAMVTPMRASGALDFEALNRLIEFHIDNGTNAIVAVGTTGESATVDVKEHCQIIGHVVKEVNGRIPVIAGTGANATAEAIELTRSAMEVGADACLLVTPYYNKPTQEGLYLHYKAVAEAVAIPQILYNVPGRTACDMLPETVARLAGLSNIVGLKEATGDLDRAREVLELCGDQLDLYSGDDATGMEFMLLGGQGVISVTNNVAPRLMSDMCVAALAGDRAAAEAINAKLALLHERLFLEANPIPAKWAVQQLGLIADGIRLPLTPLSERFHEPVREAMRLAGVLN